MIISVLVLGTLILIGTASYFEEEILAKVKESINQQVDTRIDVKEIEFSLVNDFPQASLLFHDVFIADKLIETDTLLSTEQLFLRFDIWDLLHQEYTIDEVDIKKGFLRMRTNADGQLNYVFWKTSDDTETEMSFDIEKLEMEDIYFTYDDIPADLSIHSEISEAFMKGGLSDGWTSMEIELEGLNTLVNLEDSYYLKDNRISYKGGLRVDEEGEDIFLEEAQVEVGDVVLAVAGRIFKEEVWNTDLQIQGQMELASFLKELPTDRKGSIADHHPKGMLDYELRLKGESREKTHPAVEMDFELKNGSFQFSKSGTPIRKLKAKGTYARDKNGTDQVKFSSLQAEVEQGDLTFVGGLRDFDRPSINGELHCATDLEDLLALTDQTKIESASGQIDISIKLNGYLGSAKATKKTMDRMDLQGIAELKDATFRLASSGASVTGLNSGMRLKEDSLLFDMLSLSVNEDPIQVNGNLSGLWGYLFSEDLLKVNADIQAEQIRWDNWKPDLDSNADTTTTSLPERIAMDLDLSIGAFQTGAFQATDLSAELRSSGNKLKLREVSLKSCEGALEAQMDLEQKRDKTWMLASVVHMEGMEVDEMFRQFDQFGQDFVTDVHLRGNGDSHIDLRADLDPRMKIISKSLVMDADITLNDGEFIEHPSMIEIVDAMRERNLLKPFVRADELEKEMHHLVFQQLQNSIHIENGVISIPEMRIANNAMNVGIEGSHGFDHQIDYRLDFNLRDLLVNKDNPEFLIHDDGLGHVIRLRMHGRSDEPIIELDKGAVKENRKEAIAQAKDDVKEFFKNPFKKKDPSEEKDDRPAVHIEMEGQKKEEPKATEPKEEKKKWWQVVKEDEKEEVEDPLDDGDDF